MTHTVVKSYDLMAPAFDQDPLDTALANADQLYADHRPALLQGIYTCEPAVTRQTRFEVPIPPASADGIGYSFTHIVEQSAGAGTLSVTVEEYDGGWNTLEAATGIAFSGFTTHTHMDTISASSTALRFTYTTSDGTTTYTPHSILVRPGGAAPATGALTSGFREYESTLLSTSGAPLSTEWLNRCSKNTRAVVADRLQCAVSYIQEDSTANVRHDTSNSYKPDGEWIVCGYAVASLPYAYDSETLEVYALASVDAGATAALVRVRQVGVSTIGGAVTLAADGNYNNATLTLTPDKAGTLEASATIEIAVRCTSGNTTYLHAVSAGWLPTLPDAPWNVAPGVSPPASMQLLLSAVKAVEDWAFRPWAQPAMCYEGNTTNLTQRRFTASIGLGVNHARARVTRSWEAPVYGAAQSATIIGTSSSGGFAAPDHITMPVSTYGTETYLDTGSAFGSWHVQTSGEAIDDTPAATVDRQIELTEDKAPSDETIDVQYSAGFGLFVTRLTQDRESL